MKKFRDDLKFVLHASFIIIKGGIIHIYAQVSLKYFSKLKKKKKTTISVRKYCVNETGFFP